MGPSHTREQKRTQDDAKALLWEKDDRIATLETRLEAYSARASTAQTRLLKTIDVLDALRSQHAIEISAAEQAKMRLMHEVNSWRTVANDLEVERDELKDVVEDLIEKGNLNVGFLERVPDCVLNSTKAEDSHNDLLAYATSMITRLRIEMEVERQSHSRTVEEANFRIEELEAMVAVREAELENCVSCLGDKENQPEVPQGNLAHAFEKRRFSERLADPKPLSDEECLRFLGNNTARNKSLELEIRHIAERLEQARMVASSPSHTRDEPRPPTPRSGSEVISAHNHRSSVSVDSNALSFPLEMAESPPPAPAPPSTMLSIAQLDNQIRTMTTQMDALISERNTLVEAAARQRRVTDGLNVDTFQDVLKVEGECVRLQAEVNDLREQLKYANAHARDREKSLLREIARFRGLLSSAPASYPVPVGDLHVFSPQPLEENIAAEESMELASPLIPTSVPAPLPAPLCPDLDTEADLVSFPFSPKYDSLPASVQMTPPGNTRRSSGPEDIERVQAALDVARTSLAEKEDALSELRAEMERLQLEMKAQT